MEVYNHVVETSTSADNTSVYEDEIREESRYIISAAEIRDLEHESEPFKKHIEGTGRRTRSRNQPTGSM